MQVPKVVDELMQKAGAERFAPTVYSDAAVSDIFSDFQGWMLEQLWNGLAQKLNHNVHQDTVNSTTGLKVTVGKPLRFSTRRGFVQTTITESRVLSRPGVAAKRHLSLKLPSDTVYRTGDRIQILPRNSTGMVQRVLSRFRLDQDELITVSSAARNLGIPADTPLTAADLFGAYVELGQVATARNIQALAGAAPDSPTTSALEELANASSFESKIRSNQISVLDLLERFPTVELPLSSFISMLPQMRPRAYSLSSAPSQQPGEGTLTYTVVGSDESERKTGTGGGVASKYLASLEKGNVLFVSHFPAQREFRLPPPETPIIMISTGAGLAPFRGFIQECAGLQALGKKLAPALLFFGCRGEQLDDLYRQELDDLEKRGIVTVHRAYSRQPGAACKYVQDSIVKFREEVAELWGAGAVVYVCSGKKISDAVFEVLAPVLYEVDQRSGQTKVDMEVWTKQLPRERYVMEIFN